MAAIEQQLQKHIEAEGARLDRIENKLDQLTEAMVAMARAEEKIASLQGDQNNLFERMNRHSEKLDDIQRIVDDNHRTIGIINKVFWITMVAVIGSLVAQFGVL
jgi:ribosome-binding ATPase YchF (GTP1/OBG family)